MCYLASNCANVARKWDREEKGRHLYQIQKSVKETRAGSGYRREEMVLTRLRLGHCALNKNSENGGKTSDRFV